MTMTPRHQVSRAAVTLIKRFEGFRAKAAELEDGRFTIGYGHTRTARAGTEIAEADAEALLLFDLINVAHAVNEWTYAPLNQNQFDALVSFAFNIGLENFRRSTSLRRINEGRMLEAALCMELWRRADFEGERIVIDALVRRRAYEKTLFLKPVDAWAPAPSPVLPPKIDYDVAAFTLTQTPAVLKTDLTGSRAVAARETAVAIVPREDSGPTASELAATAVSARLEAILPDPDALPPADVFATTPPAAEPTYEAPVTAEVHAAAAAASEPALAETLAFPEGEEAPRDIDTVPGQMTVDEFHGEEPPEGGPPPKPVKPNRESVTLLIWAALGFLGVALFIAALRFGFKTAGGAVAGLDPSVLGWGFGLAGIALAATSVYFLLTRLGPKEAPPPP